MTTPEDIVNRALDALGVEDVIADLQEGTKPAKAALRQYVPLRQQLLRAAHWNFARRQVNLQLVQDSTIGQRVPNGFLYEYLQPSDCVQVRFVPQQSARFVDFATYSSTPIVAGSATVTPGAMSGTISDAGWAIIAGTILAINDGVNTEFVSVTATTSTSFTATFLYNHPNPFTINGRVAANVSGNAVNPTPLVGTVQTYQSNWMAPAPFAVATDAVTAEWGVSQFGSGVQYGLGAPATVILTNVRAAQLVYTADIKSPDEWDSQFQEAFCAALASRLAMAVVEDKKFGMALLGQQVQMAKMALTEARRTNGNEGITTINREASWTRARCAYWGGQDIGSGGGSWAPWASFGFADGSTL